MRHSNPILLLSLLTTLLIPAAVQAEMYKWTDSQGVVHYGDHPPPGQETQTVAPPPPPASGSAEESKSLMERSQAVDKALSEQEKAAAEAAKKKKQEAKLAEKCQRIRRTLDTLRNRNRVQQVVDGQVVTMTTEARAAEIQRLEKLEQESCKTQGQ